MNRGMSRGRRQGNRGIPNRAMDTGSSRGLLFNDRFGGASLGRPLATEHIKLHDLDLELALLKRKRQLIEEQQQMMSTPSPFSRPSPFDFNQSKSYNQQYADPRQSMSTQSFAHYYDAPGPQFDRFDRKRPAGDSGWQNSSAPKRFGGPQRDPPKQSGGRPGQYPRPSGGGGGAFNNQTPRPQNNQRSNPGAGHPRPGNPRPGNPRPGNARPGNPRPGHPNTPSRDNNFNPSRVTKPKPKPNSAPNRLDSYPVAERRDLISKAATLATPQTQVNLVLHADKPPSRQMSGRLELALGCIFKDIKQLHGDASPTLGLSSVRAIKKAIRDRLRSAMIGKPVGTAADIIAIYRDQYPMETDKEILATGLQSEPCKPIHKLAIRLIETGNPDKFYRANFGKLINHQLDEMFSNLHNLYKNHKDNGKSVQRIIDEILLEEEGILESVINSKDSTDTKLTDESAENKLTDESQTGTADATDSQAKESGDNTKVDPADKSQAENTAEPETPIDESSIANKPTDENIDNSKTDAGTAETTPENNGNDEEITTETNGKDDDEDLSIIDMLQNDDGISETSDPKKQLARRFRANFYTKLMEVLIRRRLPYILPKYKDLILKNILHSDEAYKTTLAHVIVGTKKRAQAFDKAAQIKEVAEENPEQKTQDKPAARILPHFVKIFGHPTLPKRKLMQAFLDQFHPASIKKHRGVHNLLFVGLSDKEDFVNILAANKTVIGNCTVDVKVSERVNKPEEPKKTVKLDDSDVIMLETVNAPITIEDETPDVIDAELNDQINDLLTTIREEEERNEAAEAENAEQNQAVAESEAEKPENNGNDAEETAEGSAVTAEGSPAEAAPVATPAKAAPVGKGSPAKAAPVATPAKAQSVAVATPVSNIRTRRASRLEKQN